jgi:hypothetical protein
MLDSTNLSLENYDSTLIGWASQPVKESLELGACNLKYTAKALASRNKLINTAQHNWTIVDAGMFDYFPIKVGGINDARLVANSSEIIEYVDLDTLFSDFENDYGYQLSFAVTKSKDIVDLSVRGSDNVLLISTKGLIDEAIIEIIAKDSADQEVSHSFKLFAMASELNLVGETFVKINEFYNSDSLICDYNTNIDGMNGLTYNIESGNDLGIFEINNQGELRVVNQNALFVNTSYTDSSIFDLRIVASFMDSSEYLNTKIYSEGLYKYTISDSNIVSGIEDVQNNVVKIYPNPANKLLKIESEKIIDKIAIYSFDGILRLKEEDLYEQIKELNLNIPNGNYIVVVELVDGSIITRKLVVVK